MAVPARRAKDGPLELETEAHARPDVTPPPVTRVLAAQRGAGNQAVAAALAARRPEAVRTLQRDLWDILPVILGGRPEPRTMLPAKIAALSPAEFARWQPAQLNTLSAEQVGAIGVPQAARLLPNVHAPGLGKTFLEALQPNAAAALTPAFVAALGNTQFGGFGPAALNALVPAQLAALTTQVRGLADAVIPQLGPAFLDGIQIDQLLERHMTLLSVPQIGGLAPAQVSALTAAQVNRLLPAQLRALTQAQVAVLTQPQLAQLTPPQMHVLLPLLPPNVARLLPTIAPVAPHPGPGPGPLPATLGGAAGVIPRQTDIPAGLAGVNAAQLGAFEPHAVATFGAAEVQAISLALLPGLTLRQLAALPPVHMSALPVATFAALGDTKRRMLSVEQVANLSDLQLQGLSQAQLAAMHLSHISALLPAQISGLGNGQLAHLTDEQLRALTPAQVAAMRDAHLAALTGAQLAALHPEQLRALPPVRFAGLTQNQFLALGAPHLRALLPEQVAAIPAGHRVAHPQAKALPAAPPAAGGLPDVAGGASAAVPAVAPATIAKLSVEQIRTLSPAHVAAMVPLQIAALLGHQISALAPAAVQAWPTPSVQALGVRISHLTVEQLAALDASRLTPQQIQALSGSQLQAIAPLDPGVGAHLTQAQVRALRPPQVDAVFGQLPALTAAALTPAQVPAIGAAAFQAVATPSLQALTRPHFAALTDAQVPTLVNHRLNDLTIQQFGWLAPLVRPEFVTAPAPPAPYAGPQVNLPVGLGEARLDPNLIAALPPAMQALVPAPIGAAGGVATRLETLIAILPDKRRKTVSQAAVPAGPIPAGWAHLLTELAPLMPSFSVETTAPANAPAAMSALFSIPAIRMARAVRAVLAAHGHVALRPWFGPFPPRDRHRNREQRLPGPSKMVPADPFPYREFDIYPDPNVLGVGLAAGGVDRGAHRLVVGTWIPAGGAALPAPLPVHPGLNRWFYSPDHYATFIEI